MQAHGCSHSRTVNFALCFHLLLVVQVNKYIKLGRNRRLMHERDARPLLRDVIHRAPGNWRRRLEQCYNISHWAGAVPICLKARRAFDEARARQRLAAFQTAFAQTLLGTCPNTHVGERRGKFKSAPMLLNSCVYLLVVGLFLFVWRGVGVGVCIFFSFLEQMQT